MNKKTVKEYVHKINIVFKKYCWRRIVSKQIMDYAYRRGFQMSD